MADPFNQRADSVADPARKCWAITPHATNEVDPLPKAIHNKIAAVHGLRTVA